MPHMARPYLPSSSLSIFCQQPPLLQALPSCEFTGPAHGSSCQSPGSPCPVVTSPRPCWAQLSITMVSQPLDEEAGAGQTDRRRDTALQLARATLRSRSRGIAATRTTRNGSFVIKGSPLPCSAMNVPPLRPLALLCIALLAGASPSPKVQLLPVTTADPSSLNVTFDPGTWSLSWECTENVTVTSCVAEFREGGKLWPRRITAKGCSCQFQLMVLHHGVTLEVIGTVNHWPIHRKLYYVNAGVEGSGPQNVTCVIHDARFLMCSWGVGPAAPDDVQYFLHIRDSAGQVVTECPAYLGNHLHLGCSLEDLSLLPDIFYIIVTGSSRKAEVQFFDAKLNTKLIERLSPPDNVTVTCNMSHCEITWSQPQTWARLTFRDFRYEVDVQRQNTRPRSTNPMVRISREEQNRYIFPSPAPRLCHVVRVRAGDVRSDRWSNWSPLITFGCREQGIPRLYLYLTVACVTLLCALGLGLVCRRYMKIQEVFPPIPEIKDKVTDNEQVNPKTLREDLLLQP